MLISDIMNFLYAWTPIDSEHPIVNRNRVDGCVYNEEDRDVSKVAVCLIATPDVMKKAAEMGAELIITHENTCHEFLSAQRQEIDPVLQKKKKLIQDLDIPIYRIHDHMHFSKADKIHAGFVEQLGLAGEYDGFRTLVLNESITITELEKCMCDRLGLKHIRFVGQRDKTVKRISLNAGAWGGMVFNEVCREDIDVVICGEIDEASTCEYVRDSAQLGVDKALFILGHMGSERSGMSYMCDYMNKNLDGITATYIECEEVYN